MTQDNKQSIAVKTIQLHIFLLSWINKPYFKLPSFASLRLKKIRRVTKGQFYQSLFIHHVFPQDTPHDFALFFCALALYSQFCFSCFFPTNSTV